MPLELHCLPIRVEGTILRRFRIGDADRFHAYRSDPGLARYQGWSVMTADDALTFVREMAGVAALVPGGWVQLAVADEGTDHVLGDVGLYVDETGRDAELGFTLSRDAQGVGHATRAVAAAATLLWRVSLVAGIRAVTDARNTPSIAVLERAGFLRLSAQKSFFKGEECLEITFMLPRHVASPEDTPRGSR